MNQDESISLHLQGGPELDWSYVNLPIELFQIFVFLHFTLSGHFFPTMLFFFLNK